MKRVIRFVVGLYPVRWRRRYGVEFDALLGDISPRWRDLFDVASPEFESACLPSMDEYILSYRK